MVVAVVWRWWLSGSGSQLAVVMARAVLAVADKWWWRWSGGREGWREGVGSRVAVEWRWIGGGKGKGVGSRVVARARALAVEW